MNRESLRRTAFFGVLALGCLGAGCERESASHESRPEAWTEQDADATAQLTREVRETREWLAERRGEIERLTPEQLDAFDAKLADLERELERIDGRTAELESRTTDDSSSDH